MIYDSDVLAGNLHGIPIQRHMKKTASGKIRISTGSKSSRVIRITLLVLLGLTVVGFLTFDYNDIDLASAISLTLHNLKIVFLEPRLSNTTFFASLKDLSVTFSLGLLATFFGGLIALFASLLCASNISNHTVANVVKGFVAFIRAVPTILWVLIFAVSAGLGSVSAVAGLTFHSAGYLIKAYAESIEEVDEGAIEALKACGAGYWQIVTQAIWPSSVRYLLAWTFMRFEINFVNAVAIGAAAGSGGIGYNLWMAGSFYLDLRELGMLTYVIVAAVILLEIAATRIKGIVK